MVGIFIGVVVVVTALTIFCPKNLLYGLRLGNYFFPTHRAYSFIMAESSERKVFAALDAPASTWRTIPAVARETGLPEARVRQILDKYDWKLTRRSEVPSVSGQPLVGLIEKVGA
jgi:hypothetical protein